MPADMHLVPLRSTRYSGNQQITHTVSSILFPSVYEEVWASQGRWKSDLERARILLFWFTDTCTDPPLATALYTVATNQEDIRTVTDLAVETGKLVLRGCHLSFSPTPILQAIRFILLRARLHKPPVSIKTKKILDFVFDPTVARSFKPPHGRVVIYRYPRRSLQVAIVGGGPTGLITAIALAEKGQGHIQVHIYESRWLEEQGAGGHIFTYPRRASRRDQVVTLQDSVTSLMSRATQEVLFQGCPERVWPSSSNIQIRKVEDRLLRRCQAPGFKDILYLHAETATREDLAKIGDFHILIGADGPSSWVRKAYFGDFERERGHSFALGLGLNRPAGLPWSQPLNIFLTLGQTRYLLNASDSDGMGYLNMQLTEEEWHKMVSVDGQPVTFGRPGCLRRPDGTLPEGFRESQVFAPSEDRNSVFWKAIQDGLKLFGFKENDVLNIVRIPIVVRGVQKAVQRLPPDDPAAIKRPHALVAVVGDAAITTHFWPGRGLNTGIKSGIALADAVVHALSSGRCIGLPVDALEEYNEFIIKLQEREHDKRSIPILIQSGSPETLNWLLCKAHCVPDAMAIDWLVFATTHIGHRLEKRSDWAFKPIANLESRLRVILSGLDASTLRAMAVSLPWPTKEMVGEEVLPIRSALPEQKRWVKKLWTLHVKKTRRHTKLSASSLNC